MKIKNLQIEYIKSAFQTMKSKEDLLKLLNYSKKIIYGEKAIPFELRQLTYYYSTQVNKRKHFQGFISDSTELINHKKYYQFIIKKKSGGERIIHAPIKGLKVLQKSLNLILQCMYNPHRSATGFVLNKSIVDNAKLHTGKHYVYNIDLKDFFPSIDQARVWKCFQLQPFNLTKETGRIELANILAALCCTEIDVERKNTEGQWEKTRRNVLPQGAPTSPTITNIICKRLDFLLSAVAKRFGLSYSRYADDITFSSLHNVYQNDGEFLRELQRIISDQKFYIKESKTRLQKSGYRQEVTGLVVNERANVRNRYVKQLRMWLYYWERYGYDKASTFFLTQFLADKGHIRIKSPSMSDVIGGKLNYLKMVKGVENKMYLKLHQRFQILAGESKTKSNTNLDRVLDVLLNEGVDQAMGIYYPKS